MQALSGASEKSREIYHHRREQRRGYAMLEGTRDSHNFKCGRRLCVKSKAAMLILYWNFSISSVVSVYFDPTKYINPTYPSINISQPRIQLETRKTITPIAFSLLAILYLFFPLAGFLADIKCGRYKAVVCSLWTGLVSMVILAACAAIYLVVARYTQYPITFEMAMFAVIILTALTLIPSYITFSANVVQFGMDQLHDSSSEDSVKFIHWFVLFNSLAYAVTNIFFLLSIQSKWVSHTVSTVISVVAILVLGASLCFARWKRRWFLIDTASRNPYKLVYKVIKFAAQHKSPIRRSAFTFCEDELPSRMDLAKEKYGGPFTTEQVEDVKAFLGILSILVTLGPIFMMDIAAFSMLPTIAQHFQSNASATSFNYFNFFQVSILQDLFSATFIFLYLSLLRPFIQRWVLGMLKRIGLGMVLLLATSLFILTIDTIGHAHLSNNVCFFYVDYFADIKQGGQPQSLNISVYYLLFPYVFNALGYALFYVAIYELICSQSPHAMKGLLIGMLFTVKGIFQLIGATVVLIPFILWHSNSSFPSCGFIYYLVNMAVGVCGLVAYSCVARSYRYRERDEPDHTYRYAEEYYDRDGEESYDYSTDEHLLDIHTIDN